MLFFIIFFLVIYLSANYYLLIRLLQAFQGIPFAIKMIISALFILCALSYFIAKIFLNNTDSFIYDIFLWIGSIWFAILLDGLISVFLLDIVRWTNNLWGYLPQGLIINYQATKFWTGLIVIAAIFLTTLLGYIHASKIKLKNMEIVLPKDDARLDEIEILYFSDLHLTPVNNGRILSQILKFTEEHNPDLILIGGDLIDDKPIHLKRMGIDKSLPKLKSKYGVFAINGNHEFINGIEESDEFIKQCGVEILRDTSVEIAESIQIIGREDRSIKQFSHKERKQLSELTQSINPNLPSILLDHQPFELSEAQKANIDLELSGHTHYSQLFPLNYLLYFIYEQPWGYLKKGNTHYYVSSGAGTWGPPVRVGSDSEAMLIKIKFR